VVLAVPIALCEGAWAAASSPSPTGTWQITAVPDDGSDMINGTLRITTSGDVVGFQGSLVGQALHACGTGTVVVAGVEKIKYSALTYYFVGQSGLPGAQDHSGLTGPPGYSVGVTHAGKSYKGLLSIQFHTPAFSATSGFTAFGSLSYGACGLLFSLVPPS
jgi:hypothetical protein